MTFGGVFGSWGENCPQTPPRIPQGPILDPPDPCKKDPGTFFRPILVGLGIMNMSMHIQMFRCMLGCNKIGQWTGWPFDASGCTLEVTLRFSLRCCLQLLFSSRLPYFSCMVCTEACLKTRAASNISVSLPECNLNQEWACIKGRFFSVSSLIVILGTLVGFKKLLVFILV